MELRVGSRRWDRRGRSVGIIYDSLLSIIIGCLSHLLFCALRCVVEIFQEKWSHTYLLLRLMVCGLRFCENRFECISVDMPLNVSLIFRVPLRVPILWRWNNL